MSFACPHCGTVLDNGTDETRIIEVLRHIPWPLYGTYIADFTDLPERTVYRKLHILEQAGVVQRVGERKGWCLT